MKTCLKMAGFSALGVVVCLMLATRAAARQAEPIPGIRGEPINAPTQTNHADASVEPPPPRKRKYPKPASFQKRMVEFQVNLAGGSNALADTQTFGGSPAKVIYSPDRLKALPEPPLPPGYERIGFDALAGFPFEPTPEMADASKDLAAASAATLAKIPRSIQALDKHSVAIRGFLLPLKMNNGLAVEFLLMRSQNMCCFGTVPKVNEWIMVSIPGEGTKPTMDQPITVLGKIHVGDIRENGYLVGMYRMDAAKVIWPAGSR
jgi:hypothetical protein